MRELAGRSLTGTYLYSLCVKPDISTMSASKRSHFWTRLRSYFIQDKLEISIYLSWDKYKGNAILYFILDLLF